MSPDEFLRLGDQAGESDLSALLGHIRSRTSVEIDAETIASDVLERELARLPRSVSSYRCHLRQYQRVTLAEALTDKPKGVAGEVAAILIQIQARPTAIWGFFHRAIEEEYLLSRFCWHDVIDVLRSATNADKSLLVQLTDVFRRHILQGPIAAPGSASHDKAEIGRATSAARFFRGVKEIGWVDSDSDSLEETLAVFQRDCDAIGAPFGQHCIWGTFNEEDPMADPWTGVAPTAAALRRYLAVDEPSPIVRFRYRLRNFVDSPLKKPTIADGYSGGDWGRFVPNMTRSEKFGRTIGGAPEVVHGPDVAFYADIREIELCR